MTTLIKICGLTDSAALETAIEAGADLAGLVFFEPSPRNIELGHAADLADQARGRVRIVALSVNADDALLHAVADRIRPDFLQFHGSESPQRCVEVAERTGIGVIKAIGVSAGEDLARTEEYESVCAYVMLDAKAPKHANRPGGLGEPFDWSMLADYNPGRDWFLAGGLDPENVEQALAVSDAPGVDVSSGVELKTGVKDPDLIRRFIDAARRHDAACAA